METIIYQNDSSTRGVDKDNHDTELSSKEDIAKCYEPDENLNNLADCHAGALNDLKQRKTAEGAARFKRLGWSNLLSS